MCHNYCACAVEPGSRNYWNGAPESADAPKWEKSLQWEAQALQLEGSPCSPREKSPHSNEDAAQPKINNFSKKQREIHLKTVTMKTENGIKHATLIITQHPATGNKEERKPRSLTCITFSAMTVDWKKKNICIYICIPFLLSHYLIPRLSPLGELGQNRVYNCSSFAAVTTILKFP